MPGPWEKYAASAPAPGPWTKYGATAAPMQPPRDNSPEGLVAQIPGGYAPGQAPQQAPQAAGSGWFRSAIDRLAGPVEAGASAATGAIAAPVGALYGLGYGLTHGYGTAKGADVAEQKATQLASRMTYHPVTPGGQQLTGAMGSAFDKSGLIGLGPVAGDLAPAATLARPALRQAGAIARDEANLYSPAIPHPLRAAGRVAAKGFGKGLEVLGASSKPGISTLRGVTSDIAPRIPGQAQIDEMGPVVPGPNILAKQTQVPHVQDYPLVPALGPKPEVGAGPAEADIVKGLPGVKNGAPAAPADINAGLEKSFQETGGALEVSRKQAGRELGAIGEKSDAQAAESRANEASLQSKIQELQAEYDKTYKNATPAAQARPYPTQLRQRIAALQDELSKTQRVGSNGQSLDQTLGALRKNVDAMAEHDIGPAQSELKQVAAQISDIQKNPATQLERLIKLRRYISERAGYTDPATGAKAISEHNARELSAQINQAIDSHIPEYAAMREKYGEILDQQEPYGSKLLRAMNEPEGSTDYTGAILRDGSLKNLELAKKAAGSTQPVDTAMSQRVVNDLHGKSLDQTAEYLRKNQRVLNELPQAKKAAADVLARRSAADLQVRAQKALVDKYNAQLDAQQKALQLRRAQLQARNAAQDEVNRLYKEQQDLAAQRANSTKLANQRAQKLADQYQQLLSASGSNLKPSSVRGFLNSARDAGLVNDAEYARSLKDIDRAEGMLTKSAERQRILKSALWGATGSFGAYLLGRELFSYFADENSRH